MPEFAPGDVLAAAAIEHPNVLSLIVRARSNLGTALRAA